MTTRWRSEGSCALQCARLGPLDEGQQRAAGAVGGRVVEGDPHGAAVARGLAGEAVAAPEGLVVAHVDLDDAAHRHALRELVARGGQQRVVADAARRAWGAPPRRRRPRATSPAVGGDGHAVVVLADAAHRRLEPHRVAELGRHAHRDLLGPVEEALLLRAPGGGEQGVERGARVDVEEEVQQRDVARLGGEHRLDAQPQQVAGRARGHVAADPRLDRLAVEHVGSGVVPRGVERHPAASRSMRAWAWPTSAITTGLIMGMAPL